MPSRGRLTLHEKLAAQYLALGMSMTEAAQSADMELTLLRRAMSHPLFEAEIERCRQRAFPIVAERLTQRLEQLQEPALERMGSLMQAESEAVQFQASRDLLNRGPLAPKPAHPGRELPAQGATIHLDQQALQAILAGALNMGQHGIVAAFAALGHPQPLPQEQGHEPHTP